MRCRGGETTPSPPRSAYSSPVNSERPGPDPTDVYRPPIAAATGSAPPAASPPFYVVSTTKFAILYVGTFTIYGVYWFYKQWRMHQLHTWRKVRPFWRAIFSIFFVHQLFREIHRRGADHPEVARWGHAGAATLFVVLSIVSGIIDRITMRSETFSTLDLIGIVLALASGIPLHAAQGMVNIACGDPTGASNSRMSVGNVVALLVGALFWLFVVVGFTLPE